MISEKIFSDDDLYSSGEEKKGNILFIKSLTTLGKYIKKNGMKIDITKSRMERVQYIFDTEHQKITLQENTFYDDSARQFVVNYSCEFGIIVEIQKTNLEIAKMKFGKEFLNSNIGVFCQKIVDWLAKRIS